jgi:hypothetical protein
VEWVVTTLLTLVRFSSLVEAVEYDFVLALQRRPGPRGAFAATAPSSGTTRVVVGLRAMRAAITTTGQNALRALSGC